MNFDSVFEQIMSATPGHPHQREFISADELPCVSGCLEFPQVRYVEPLDEQWVITDDLPFINIARLLNVKIMYESPHGLESKGLDGNPAIARYASPGMTYFKNTIFLRCRNAPLAFIHELTHAVQRHLGYHTSPLDHLLNSGQSEFVASFMECIFAKDDIPHRVVRTIFGEWSNSKMRKLFADTLDEITAIYNFFAEHAGDSIRNKFA